MDSVVIESHLHRDNRRIAVPVPGYSISQLCQQQWRQFEYREPASSDRRHASSTLVKPIPAEESVHDVSGPHRSLPATRKTSCHSCASSRIHEPIPENDLVPGEIESQPVLPPLQIEIDLSH